LQRLLVHRKVTAPLHGLRIANGYDFRIAFHAGMSRFFRLGLAVLVSSLSVVPLFIVIEWVSGGFDSFMLDVALLIAAVTAFLGVVIVGLPMHYFLSYRNLSKALHYAIAGFLLPVLFVAMIQPFRDDDGFRIIWQALLMGVFGALVALVFRAIAQPKAAQQDHTTIATTDNQTRVTR